MVNLRCGKSAEQIDALLSGIERSMEMLTVYTNEYLGGMERLKYDDIYLEEFTKQLESVTVNAANNTEETVAVYVRYNPEFTPSMSGLFWSKTGLSGGFQRSTLADSSKYNPSGAERVGWYYIPIKNEKAIWIVPYNNEDINLRMISYVISVYRGNETINVTGMDINFTIIEDLIGSL